MYPVCFGLCVSKHHVYMIIINFDTLCEPGVHSDELVYRYASSGYNQALR